MRYSYPILLILFILWMCIGIFPLECYETDGQEIILGCDIMYNEGWKLPPVYSYAYWMQPLCTILIVGIKHIIPVLTCEQIYCLLTVIASLFFLFGSISFARHITKASKTRILIAAMLLPEMYAIAMYPNTAIPAAACFVWALVFLTKKRYWQAAVLMCIAVLFRLDIVMVFPVILPLLWYEGKTFLRSFGISAIYGVIVVVASFFLFWIVGAQLLHTMDEYDLKNGLVFTQIALSVLGYYSLAYLILLPIGLCIIAANKQWKLILMIILPILLSHYFTMGSASKHFLYNSPFVIIAGVYALSWLEDLLKEKPVLKWACFVLVLLFMTVSIRKQNLNMPWLKENPLHQVGIATPIYQTQRASSEYTIGIGAGYQIITADENMLLTGHLFYSWYIHSIKNIIGDWRRQQLEVLQNAPTSNILAFEWGTLSPVAFELVKQQKQFHQIENMPEEYMFTISDSKQDLHFWRVPMYEDITDCQKILTDVDSLSKKFLKGDLYLVAGSNHYSTSHLMDDMVKMGKAEKKAETVYRMNR